MTQTAPSPEPNPSMPDVSTPETDAAGSGVIPNFVPLYLGTLACSAAMMGFVSLTGPLAKATDLTAWQMGVTVTVTGLVWVLCATYWGRLSDRIGRRPVILTGLGIFLLAFVVMVGVVAAGFAGWIAGIWALLALVLSRSALGLAYSAIPAGANALIADYIAADHRAAYMGRFGAAQAMGLIVGPGVVAAASVVSVAAGLIVLALLVALAFVYVLLHLPEGRPAASEPKRMSPFDPRIRASAAFGFMTMAGIGIAQITVGFVALERFGLPAAQATQVAGLALTAVGAVLIPAQLLISKLGWAPDQLLRRGAVIATCGASWAALAADPIPLIAGYALSGFGCGWIIPATMARASIAVSAGEQGQAGGGISAAQGLGAMVGPIVGAVLFDVWDSAPMLLAAAGFAAVGLCGVLWPSQRHDP